ncbi:MAG: glycoside hydrolase family 48 [Parcubacteria group bacterium Gr01-1014_72]|nr:MAG: glycoside hydrolase family 48 [Parcubacteria group bacterium Gr01-1014_72]
MSMYKYKSFFALLFVFALFVLPLFSSAQSPDKSSILIQQLQQQVAELQRQIQTLQRQLTETRSELGAQSPASAPIAEPETETAPAKTSLEFTRILSRGSLGDDVRRLQEFLAEDKEIYPDGLVTGYFGPLTESALKKWQHKHGIEAVGILGPQTKAKFSERGRGKIQELVTEGAGASGVIPPGLQKKSEGTATSTIATTTPPSPSTENFCAKDPKYCATEKECAAQNYYWYTVSCHKTASPPESCARSYNYCVGSSECSANGWYWCRNSCYSSENACQGQTYVAPAQPAAIPALPATPAQPTSQTGTTTVSATPATPAVPATVATSTTTGDTTPPSTPTGLTATPSTYNIALRWSKSTDNIGVAGYKVYRNGTQIFSAATSTSLATLSTTDFGLTSSTSYTYTVAAYDAAGNISVPSSSVSAAILAPVPPVPATNTGIGTCSGFSLVFKDNKTTYTIGEMATYTYSCASGAASYVRMQVVKPDGVVTTYVTGTGNLTTQTMGFGTDNLVAGSHTLRACYDADCYFIADSKQFTVTAASSVSQVQGLVAAVSGTSVNLSWQAISGISTYNIHRGTSTDFVPIKPGAATGLNFNHLAQGNVLSYTDSNLSAGTYYYKVVAQDVSGNVGPASSAVSATIAAVASPPPAPTGGTNAGGYIGAGWPLAVYVMSVRFNYDTANLPQVASFRTYQKKPGDAAFNLLDTFNNPSAASSCSTTVDGSNGWRLSYSCSAKFWIVGMISTQTSSYFPVGDYEFYITAVSSSGAESVPSPTQKIVVKEPTAIVSPTESQSPVASPPQFRWTTGGSYAYIVLYDEGVLTTSLNPLYYKVVSGGATSFTYDGSALDPSKKYVVIINSPGSVSRTSVGDITTTSFAQKVEKFWISTATTTSSIDNFNAVSQLAQILESLSDILNSLKRLR